MELSDKKQTVEMKRRGFISLSSKLLVLASLGGLAGCGGGNGGGGGKNPVTPPDNTPKTARAKLIIDWAARTRNIGAVSSAMSVVITVVAGKSGGGDVTWNGNRDATRMEAHSETYTSPSDVLVGQKQVNATFFAEADGKGAQVGVASGLMELKSDGSYVGDIKTTGTITTVKVNSGQSVNIGETKDLFFTALDKNNAAIAVSPGSAVWAVSNGGDKISLTPDGNVKGIAGGQASVTVTVDGVTSPAQTVATVDPQVRQALLNFIMVMPHIEVQPEGTTKTNSSSSQVGDQTVTTDTYHSALTVTELAGFNPNIGVIWPGALVQGSSLKTGVLAAINTERTDGTILLSTLGIPSGGGKTKPLSALVSQPSAATIEQARSGLIQNGFVVPAKLGQIFKQFYSLDHAMIEVGASASYLGSSIKAQLDLDKFKTQSNVMVWFTQEYYTVAMDAPTSPISYFGASVTAGSLQPYANTSDNPIGYVQSVTYGRLGLLLASSSESYDNLERSIKAAVSFYGGNADASYGDAEKKIVRESDIKMLLMGGSPDKALRLVPTTQQALDTMQAWINQPITATPGDIQLGVPISYRVNYLKDNQLALLSFSTDYDRVSSSPIPKYTNWSITFNTADDDKDNDTALTVEVYNGNTLIATHSENGQTFDNGSSITRGLDQVQTLYVKDATNIRLHIRIDPNGNDTWNFAYALTASNSGGGANFAKNGSMRLSQDNRDGWQ